MRLIKNIINTSSLSIFLLVLSISGCKKLVEADAPKTGLSEANVYNSDVTAISVLTGLYHQLSQEDIFSGNKSISLLTGLSADEFTLDVAISTDNNKYFHYIDSLFSNTMGSQGVEYWSQFYNYIFVCNAAIEGLERSAALTPAVKQQLLGEAKFMRGFFYFYLVNLYGNVPLVTSTDWQLNAKLTRSPKQSVYDQIITDLKEAETLLSDKYLDANLEPYIGTSERVRPTKWGATALLARTYLYTNDWINAEAEATVLINNSSLYNLAALNDAFFKNSSEAIWQLQPILSGRNTYDAVLFLIPSTGPGTEYPVFLSAQLLNNFEMDDQRRYNRNWVDSVIIGTDTYYFPYKYKAGYDNNILSVSDLSEYLMMLRLGEQYLIRSEARAQLNNIAGAQADLNAIRNRAGLGNTTAADQTSLLEAIRHERQVELFSEWGHRWFDLKRTGNVDAVMSVVTPLKSTGSSWKSYQQLYPILFTDIQKNPNLVQNPGYN